MATPFSAPDEAIINEVVPLSQLTLTSTSKAQDIPVSELYDTQVLCDKITAYGFRRVALQFPDELLCDASNVVWDMQDKLRQARSNKDNAKSDNGAVGSHAPKGESGQGAASAVTSAELFVLADTSYGNCCVDEVAAEHVDADLVIHFGHACLSPTARLPTIYVFHKLPIEAEHTAHELAKAYHSISRDDSGGEKAKSALTPVLMYDVGYEHVIPSIRHCLARELGVEVAVSEMDKLVNWDRYVTRKTAANGASPPQSHAPASPNDMDSVPRKNVLPHGVPAEGTAILYVGPEALALTNLLLRLGPTTIVIRYDATTRETRTETGKTNRLLQRRYVAVQKARDAQTVALLVGTLGMRSYLPLLKDLRRHLTEVQGKRVYTISVGKLNPAKLANFQEVDVFVLIACPENSLIDAAAASSSGQRAVSYDSRDFFRPIVTPFELLMAFKGRAWGREYVLDLEEVYADVRAAEGSERRQRGKQRPKHLGGEVSDPDPDGKEVEGDIASSGSESVSSDEEPHFSLVTGGLVSRSAKNERNRLRRAQQQQQQEGGDGMHHVPDATAGVVMVRGTNGTLTRVIDSAGAAHVAGRSWRGLEQRIGMDEAAPLETGRTGIAAGYVAGTDDKHEGSSVRPPASAS